MLSIICYTNNTRTLKHSYFTSSQLLRQDIASTTIFESTNDILSGSFYLVCTRWVNTRGGGRHWTKGDNMAHAIGQVGNCNQNEKNPFTLKVLHRAWWWLNGAYKYGHGHGHTCIWWVPTCIRAWTYGLGSFGTSKAYMVVWAIWCCFACISFNSDCEILMEQFWHKGILSIGFWKMRYNLCL